MPYNKNKINFMTLRGNKHIYHKTYTMDIQIIMHLKVFAMIYSTFKIGKNWQFSILNLVCLVLLSEYV